MSFASLQHHTQAGLLAGLMTLVPATLLASIEGLWATVPIACLVSGFAVSAFWQVLFRNPMFNAGRAVFAGSIAVLLCFATTWLVLAAYIGTTRGDAMLGFAMLVIGTMGLSIVLPILLPLGVVATVMLRKWQCREPGQG